MKIKELQGMATLGLRRCIGGCGKRVVEKDSKVSKNVEEFKSLKR